MRRARWRKHRTAPDEMNITAFMNLMVILVPFLLITAVFSRMTILELSLPSAAAGTPETKQELQLEVTIRADALEVGERRSGVLRRIDKTAKGHDFSALSQTLRQVKERFPDKTGLTILLEPNTPYDLLVQVMDTARTFRAPKNGVMTAYELFPDVSIGDAPSAAGAVGRTAMKQR